MRQCDAEAMIVLGRQSGFGRWVLLAVVATLVAAFFVLDLGRYLDLAYLNEIRDGAADAVRQRPYTSSAVFFLIYVLVTALSLPGAAVMTLAGGAFFGLGWGLLLVSFASSLGATLAMLVARILLRDWVQGRFGVQLALVNRGFETDGGFYLFSLRMVPLFPFFVINLVMGLTPISAWQFYWVSQVGMLAGTVVYVFAGTQLASVDSLGDVLSPGLIVAFSLLGLFPLITRKLLQGLNRWRSQHENQED